MNMIRTLLCTKYTKNLLIAAAAAALMAGSPAEAAAGPKVLRFTAAEANKTGAVMNLNHAALDGKPTLRLIVSQYSTGVANPHPIGLRYNPFQGAGKWQVINEDLVDIPDNVHFNVMILPGTKRVSVTPANLDGIFAFFPYQKGNAAAKLLTTHVINPYVNLDGVIQPNNIGLMLGPMSVPAQPSNGRWSLYQESGDQAIAAAYNMADVTNLKSGKTAISFRHSAAVANSTGSETVITNPLTDGKPDAVLFVQHVFTQGGNVDFDETLGVRYSGGKWKIFAQDGSNLPVPSEFNVVAFPAVTSP